MTRNLKVLGLAFVAAFAMSAVVASAASAQGKLTTGGPSVTLTATETGQNALTFPVGGGAYDKVECTDTYKGHKITTTPHALVPNNATQATITPTYTGCASLPSSGGSFPSTVTMNGCDYQITLGATTGGADTYAITFDVVCPAGKVIEVHSYLEASHGFSVCTTTVGGQTGLKGAHATGTTVAPHDIDLAGTITGIKASKHGLCGAAETTNATFDLDLTVKGETALGVNVPITVTD